MKGLDLRKFTKLKSDAKTTTLKHPDGHTITLAHNALSPANQKDLHALPFANGGKVKKMADGGNTDDVAEAPSDNAAAMQAGATGQSVATQKKQSENYSVSRTPASPEPSADAKYKQSVRDFNSQMAQPKADGGMIKNYDDGGGISAQDDLAQSQDMPFPQDASSQMPQQQTMSEQDFANAHPIMDRLGLNGKMFGGPGMSEGNSTSDLYGVPTSGGMGMSPTQAVSPGPDGVQPVIPGTTDQPSQQQAMTDQGPANMPAQQQPQDISGGVPAGMQAGLNMQMQGLQNQYQAEKQAGAEKAKALQSGIDQQSTQAKSYDEQMAKLQQERQNILNDKIDPKHLWNSKDTMGKVSTILGLLVGGFGGNQGNGGVKALDTAIERDIDAQKTNKSNSLNALTQMFGDARAAADYHRVILNDQVAHGIDLAMAHAATPQALANLQQAKGKLMFDSGIRMAQIGAQQTLNSAHLNPDDINKSLNTLRMLDPAKAKEFESRIIPNVGVGNVPIDNKTREAFSAGQTFMQQMDQLEKFRQMHRGAIVGAAADEGNRLAELARNSFRIAQGEGVFKAGSQHFNERLIPDPTQIDLLGKNKNAYSDMKGQAMRELQNSMSANGIRPFANSPVKPQGSPSGYQPKSFQPVRK